VKSSRKLIWVERSSVRGNGCSECAWVFGASGWPIGDTVEQMLRNFHSQLSKEFASHLCTNHSRTKSAKAKLSLIRPVRNGQS
jgi:hypothetical protein